MTQRLPIVRFGAALVVLCLLQAGCFFSERKGNVDSSGKGKVETYGGCRSMTGVAKDGGTDYSAVYKDEDTASDNTSPVDAFIQAMVIFAVTQKLMDPQLLQVPADMTGITATYKGYPGVSGNMVVQAGLSSVEVTPGKFITPEPGCQLVLIDFPEDAFSLIPDPPAEHRWFKFTLNFQVSPARTVSIKTIGVGKVTGDGHTYYLPLFPAVTDFSKVPAIVVPQASSLQTLVFPKASELPGCGVHVRYSYGYENLLGDLNEDSIMNDEDYLLLCRYLTGSIRQGSGGFTAPLAQADLNADGRVDILDLVAMLS